MSSQPQKTADIAKVIAKRREAVIARQETWALVRRVLVLAVIAFFVLTQSATFTDDLLKITVERKGVALLVDK